MAIGDVLQTLFAPQVSQVQAQIGAAEDQARQAAQLVAIWGVIVVIELALVIFLLKTKSG